MSYSGSDHTTPGLQAAELQLAPKGEDGPDFATLRAGYETTVSRSQSFFDQCQQNKLTRYAIWPGQSSDGKKWAREGSKIDPTPWAGASDLRVYEVDAAINRKVALYRMAFKRANIVATPIEGTDFKRARMVSDFMRWIIHTQIPDIDRQIELLANYINEKGIGALGIFWATKQEKTLTKLTLQEMQAQMPDVDMMAILLDDSMEAMVTESFERMYGCTPAKARKMRKDLIRSGTTTVATLGKQRSYPVIRAFDMSEQLFVPPDTTDVESATGFYRVEYYSPEQLRAFVVSDGWDADWVEKAIECCRGKSLSLPPSQFMQPINRSFVYQTETFLDNKVGVIYAYERKSDEDGIAGTYLTIFSPCLPPDTHQEGYAKSGLLEYAHGQYPFVIFRREFLSSRMLDTRGIPEPGKSWQDAIKAHRDSRIDAASIAIIPPLGFPMGRPPTKWGPGSRIPERRPNEVHFLDKPTSDPLTEQSEIILTEGFKTYCGFASKDSDPTYVQALTQNEVDRFLAQLSKAFTQVYALYGQYGDDKVSFRVMGLKDQAALEYVKGDISESFDFYLQFDTQSTDVDMMQTRWKAILDGIQLLDRNGNVNFSSAIQAYVESIDPVIAERILDPTEVGQERVMAEEQDDLTKIFAGFNVNLKPTTPPQLAKQAMETWMQSPDVQQKYQQDQSFRERVDARMKQTTFAEQQQQNKQIGRQGAMMPGPTLT